MNLLDLEGSLRSGEIDARSGFEILQEISRHVAQSPDAERTQDLVILALDRREDFPEPLRPIVDALVAARGLFPHLSPEHLGAVDLLRYEYNRPLDYDQDLVFHEAQSEVYRLLMQGESVVLSAPTSFGKSLLMDAVIASGMYDNLAVVVPTIALLDETRRRFQRFRPSYQVVTHQSQRLGERNVFVLTQERLLEFSGLPPIDFFVIDEFYKLSPRQGDERSALLNLALYRLLKTARAFYMIGPSVLEVESRALAPLRAHLLIKNYKTVTTIVERVAKKDQNLEGLIRICGEQDAPSLVYCSGPDSARAVGKGLAAAREECQDEAVREAVEWVGREYHEQWSFVACLNHGVGLHHGRIPRALQQMAVRLFDEGKIRFLVCTATLIEGVNTAAKNVMIYDKKLGTRNFDYFTYCNICGRAGRMSRHFVGRVFLFKDPPTDPLPTVDIPVLSQPEDLALELIVDMEYEDLGFGARERLARLQDVSDLPMSVVRQSHGVDPETQMRLARRVSHFSDRRLIDLGWRGMPSGDQVEALCELVWTGFFGDKRYYGVSSAKQLASRMRLASALRLRDWIQRDVSNPDVSPDQAVESALEFLRHWCGFALPRYGRAVERIVRHEQAKRGLPEANYSLYLGQVEATFLPSMVAALDEYGVPSQIAQRLHSRQSLPDNLDDAADALRRAAADGLLSDFERRVVESALGTTIVGQRRFDFDEAVVNDDA